jgi:site-specific DNA recombinase
MLFSSRRSAARVKRPPARNAPCFRVQLFSRHPRRSISASVTAIEPCSSNNTKIARTHTRDKMSAARKKGKWVGGCPVLGYDVEPGGGRLVVNEAEAERVRPIFALFEEHGSIAVTLVEIERRGWRLKSWTRKQGAFRAGGLFTLAALRRLLNNILYTGAVRHKGQTCPGEHAAILAPGVW